VLGVPVAPVELDVRRVELVEVEEEPHLAVVGQLHLAVELHQVARVEPARVQIEIAFSLGKKFFEWYRRGLW
jgi:hypothetical protein